MHDDLETFNAIISMPPSETSNAIAPNMVCTSEQKSAEFLHRRRYKYLDIGPTIQGLRKVVVCQRAEREIGLHPKYQDEWIRIRFAEDESGRVISRPSTNVRCRRAKTSPAQKM